MKFYHFLQRYHIMEFNLELVKESWIHPWFMEFLDWQVYEVIDMRVHGIAWNKLNVMKIIHETKCIWNYFIFCNLKNIGKIHENVSWN